MMVPVWKGKLDVRECEVKRLGRRRMMSGRTVAREPQIMATFISITDQIATSVLSNVGSLDTEIL